MFSSQEIEIIIGVRFGYVVDIVVKSNIKKSESEEVQKLFQSMLMCKLLELNEISQRFQARFFEGQPVNIPMNYGDVSVSTTVVFENHNKMYGFLQDVKKCSQDES